MGARSVDGSAASSDQDATERRLLFEIEAAEAGESSEVRAFESRARDRSRTPIIRVRSKTRREERLDARPARAGRSVHEREMERVHLDEGGAIRRRETCQEIGPERFGASDREHDRRQSTLERERYVSAIGRQPPLRRSEAPPCRASSRTARASGAVSSTVGASGHALAAPRAQTRRLAARRSPRVRSRSVVERSSLRSARTQGRASRIVNVVVPGRRYASFVRLVG
jgi:hypothetical protein